MMEQYAMSEPQPTPEAPVPSPPEAQTPWFLLTPYERALRAFELNQAMYQLEAERARRQHSWYDHGAVFRQMMARAGRANYF
jgi:hypothetical protein